MYAYGFCNALYSGMFVGTMCTQTEDGDGHLRTPRPPVRGEAPKDGESWGLGGVRAPCGDGCALEAHRFSSVVRRRKCRRVYRSLLEWRIAVVAIFMLTYRQGVGARERDSTGSLCYNGQARVIADSFSSLPAFRRGRAGGPAAPEEDRGGRGPGPGQGRRGAAAAGVPPALHSFRRRAFAGRGGTPLDRGAVAGTHRAQGGWQGRA